MNKIFKIILVICLSICLILTNTIIAQESNEPLIVLQTEDNDVGPGDEIKFLIFYGNKGPADIENAEIILDLFVDGDTDLEYVSSTKSIDAFHET